MDDDADEIYCTICGVSFNFGRIRTPEEIDDNDASWFGIFGNFPFGQEGCSSDDGCLFYHLELDNGNTKNEKVMITKEEAFDIYKTGRRRIDGIRAFTHLAGPHCRSKVAYNGHFITAQEMRGCNTSQCLKWKTGDWAQVPDDEEFEREGRIFLTGLCDRVLPPNRGNFRAEPPRHGFSQLQADDKPTRYSPYPTTSSKELAMPFHPTCLEVYKRAICLTSSRITIHDLMLWRDMEYYDSQVSSFSRDPAVDECGKFQWVHLHGTEWLAANPIFIPDLPSFLDSAVSEDPDFSSTSSVFPRDTAAGSSRSTHDPLFSKLPHEIREEILVYLSIKDVATLRLASQTFTPMTHSYFHKLIRSQWPWLWEIDDFKPPSFWTTVSVSDLRSRENRRKRYTDEYEELRANVKTNRSDSYEQWILDQPAFDESIEEALKVGFKKGKRTERMNWYELYMSLPGEILRGGLKGLRNRIRIWHDVEEIISEIESFQEMEWQKIVRGYLVDENFQRLA